MHNEIERIERAYRERDASGVTALYSYENPAFLFHMQEREKALLKALKNSGFRFPGKSVLEVGCGTGHILHRFLEFGASHAAGIELMPNRVLQAKQSYPALDIQQGNAAALPYPDDSFDLVTQFMCISSVHEPELRRKIAVEMWRVLKPGGVFMSYDLRPTLGIYGLTRAFLGKLRRRFTHHANSIDTTSSLHVTPIKPLGIREIESWKLGTDFTAYKVSLNFAIADIARYSWPAARILALAPWLRSSLLVILKKPESI